MTILTRRTCTGQVVRVSVPDYWHVDYEPFEIKGKARSYWTSGVATFPRRDDARDYVKQLRTRFSVCKEHINADKYIRCTAFDKEGAN